MADNLQIKTAIKAEALRLGFAACGFAKAEPVSPDVARHLRQWLDEGHQAGMGYMANWFDKRVDPRLLMPGAKTIVSVAMNYAPARTLPEGEPQIAAYALGKDYHDVVKKRLRLLADFAMHYYNADGLDVPCRIFVDSGPVLERYWAVKAGLGWMGRSHQLIIPRAGSMFFLGELLLPISLPADEPMASRCGQCHRCIDACPTQALNMSGDFDSARCLSYQTIENRGELSAQALEAMGDCFYGCDRCQQACPWNRFAKPNDTPELQPNDELLSMTREQWRQLTPEQYRRLFKGSAVKRAKYDGLMRNIKAMERARQTAAKPGNGDKTDI